jgi:hypothetical protein
MIAREDEAGGSARSGPVVESHFPQAAAHIEDFEDGRMVFEGGNKCDDRVPAGVSAPAR